MLYFGVGMRWRLKTEDAWSLEVAAAAIGEDKGGDKGEEGVTGVFLSP